MRLLSLAAGSAVAVLSLLAPAVAEETAPPPPPTTETQPPAPPEQTTETQKPAEDPNEIICKKEVGSSETRLKRRSKDCRTRAEWEKITDDSQEYTRRAQDAPRMPPPQ